MIKHLPNWRVAKKNYDERYDEARYQKSAYPAELEEARAAFVAASIRVAIEAAEDDELTTMLRAEEEAKAKPRPKGR